MRYRLITFWAYLWAPAHAGSLTLTTDTAVEVQYGETTIARASEAGSLQIGELPEGPVRLRLVRLGKPPIVADVDVNKTGTTTMALSGNSLTIQGKPIAVQTQESPVVLVKPANTQRFTMIINGQDRRTIEDETIIEDLKPGTHQIEFRSEDQLLVWVRGTLALEPGSTVSLFIEEGHMVKPSGTANAWTPNPGL